MSGEGTKRMHEIIEQLLQLGWRVKRGGSHWRCYPPDRDQPPMTLSVSPSGSAIRNAISDLRRRGAVLR